MASPLLIRFRHIAPSFFMHDKLFVCSAIYLAAVCMCCVIPLVHPKEQNFFILWHATKKSDIGIGPSLMGPTNHALPPQHTNPGTTLTSPSTTRLGSQTSPSSTYRRPWSLSTSRSVLDLHSSSTGLQMPPTSLSMPPKPSSEPAPGDCKSVKTLLSNFC